MSWYQQLKRGPQVTGPGFQMPTTGVKQSRVSASELRAQVPAGGQEGDGKRGGWRADIFS